MQKVRYAPPDPTLPKPWRGLVDSATSNLYFWNPETNVTTYVRPTADPHPDLDKRSDRIHEIHGVVDLSSCGDDINNDDPSHKIPGVNRDTSSQLNDQHSVHASETHEEDHGQKHESTVLVKRKDTNESRTPKKQKTTSPPLIVDAAKGHVEESIMKPTEVSQSVDKEHQESDEVHKPDQLVKEKQKMSEVEGEVPQSASTNEAKLLQANRSETFEMNVISSICTTLLVKETGNSLPEEMPIVGTDPNLELLSVADGCKSLGEEMIDRDGLMDQDVGPIIDNMSNGNLYVWNPETNVTTYLGPTADLDNRSDQIHENHGMVNLNGCGDDINNGDPSHQAKWKDTSESRTSKKQKTTSPPSVIDDVEESIMKPTEISHLVDKEQQESDEINKQDQLAKEKRKMSEVEVPPSASTNGAELLQANRSETFEINVISSICTTLVAKETGNSLPEEMPIVDTDTNEEVLSVADGRKGLVEEMIDREGLTDQDSGPIIDNMLNGNVYFPMIDSTQIETNLEKQPINRSLALPVNKVEEDMAWTDSIDRLAGVTDQLSETVEAMRYMIQYVVSAKETDVQRRCENEELKKNVEDLKKKIADLEAKLKETMVGNQHARCQFLGS